MERRTKQRGAIRRVLEKAGRPLAPAEILAGARRRSPRIGIATVYRNLKLLREEGWIVSVEIPGEPDRYELAGKDHHHHFHCRDCGRVYEVPECPSGLDRLTPAGFRLAGHEIVLYGTCSGCAA